MVAGGAGDAIESQEANDLGRKEESKRRKISKATKKRSEAILSASTRAKAIMSRKKTKKVTSDRVQKRKRKYSPSSFKFMGVNGPPKGDENINTINLPPTPPGPNH